MQIEIDPGSLSSEERYHLSNGLEALKNPSQSCREVLAELKRLARKNFNEHCAKHPYDWV